MSTPSPTPPTGPFGPRSEEPAFLASLRTRWPGVTELLLFCLVGASGVAVDYCVFVPLVHFELVDARLAAIPAFLVAVSWNWMGNRRYTFTPSETLGARRSYASFVAVCTAGVGVRIAVMHLLMVGVGWRDPPAIYLTSFIGIVAATATNFLGSKFVAFRR